MIEPLNVGVELMLIGMGIVFLFLVMLIGAVNLMSAVVLRFFPEPSSAAPQHGVHQNTTMADQQSVIAAISAAIHQHRVRKS